MSAMMSLAKRRAAMVVGNFDFTNNGAPLTALPAILTALNATYTRNSVKNVVQNGALVALSANQFGTSYDDVTGLYGYVPEPAATNLAMNSDGAATTYTVSNVVDGTAVTGFTNGLAFGDNSVQRSATKSISVTSGTNYSVSFFVIMDDGNAPVVGTTNSTGDFSITLNAVIATTKLERVIGSNVYRVSASIAASATASHAAGCIKYTGQSARTFRITGIQIETGLRATSYIATAGSTASRSADALTVPLWINNAKDSQDGSTANWTRGNSTVVTSGTAPDGTATAQLCTATASGMVTLYSNSTKAPAATVTYSIYVKQGNKSTCPLILRNSTTSTNFTQGILTFATGTITGAGWTVTNEGGGWFRCKYTQSTGISVGDTLSAFVCFAGSGTDVLSDNVYFWGVQIEPGSVATTYRPTVNNLEYARNLASFSDGALATYGATSNTADGTAVPGFTNGIVFGNNSVDRGAWKIITLAAGVTYTVSVFVIMDDGGAPVAGASFVSGDFRLTVDGYGTGAGTAVHVGNNVYRVSASFTAITGGARNCGLGKYTGQSARTFRVTGIQVESGSTLTSYEPTNTRTPSANANITGFSSAGYTLAVDQRMDTTLAASVNPLELSSLSTVDRVFTYAGAGVTSIAALTANSVSQGSVSGVAIGLTRKKYAASFSLNNIMLATAGVAATPDTSATMPTGLLCLHIGAAYNSASQYNGFLFNTKLITTPITQAQLNGLTT